MLRRQPSTSAPSNPLAVYLISQPGIRPRSRLPSPLIASTTTWKNSRLLTMETTTSSDEDGRASSYLGILWFLVVAPTVFLGLRIFTKLYRRCGLWWDDHILIASWVCVLIQACIMTSSVGLGFGKHMVHVDPANYTTLLLEGSLSTMFSVLAATWSKTSFAFTLLRLCKTRPWMKLVLWLIIVSMNVLMYLTIILKFVQCNPVAKNWDSSLPGTCWPRRVFIGFAMTSGCTLATYLLQ